MLPPLEAYENRVECATVAELEQIKDNSDLIHLESLIVRERILGKQRNNCQQNNTVIEIFVNICLTLK